MMRSSVLALGLLVSSAAFATPSGDKWFLDACPCDSGMQCLNNKCYPVYKIAASIDNTGGMTLNGGPAYSSVLTRIQNAFANWTSARVTTCSTGWNIIYGGTYSTPTGRGGVGSGGATVSNNVVWLTGGNWSYGSATLGLTTTHYYTPSRQIFDADMELNNNTAWSETGEASKWDYESVVVHEAGHFLGLNHTTNQAVAVMYPTVANGVQKRSLATPDSSDVCSVYPGVAGGQGSTCTAAATCTGGRVCEGPTGSTSKICTQDCTAAGQSCPASYTCQASTSGFACLPVVGAPDLCKFCASGQDCSTGNCLTDGEGVNWCSSTCSSAANCGANYDCQMISGTGYCVPTNVCTNQCTTAAQCAVGYACTAGTCTPTGNVGDRCEVSDFCKPCSACVLDSTNSAIAYCRSCCGGGAGNALCKTCTGTTCANGTSCVGLSNNIDSVCLPSSGQAACQTCSGSNVCASGLQCVNGKCYPSCSPSNPGSCGACYNQGNGTGVCGCQNQLALQGEACGPVTAGGGISACVTGQACVGTPKVCRVQCDTANPGSCNTGFQCQLVDNTPVCMPEAAGGVCTACSSQGLCGSGSVCIDNRCYTPCNVNVSGTCSSCVEIQAGGVGVCACDDQKVGLGGVCGSNPIAACQAGLACFNGTCRNSCFAANPTTCFPGQVCESYQGNTYCIDPGGSSGGGTAGGGDGTSGGGVGASGGGAGTGTGGSSTGGGNVTADPCGCTSAPGAAMWGAALLLLLRRRRQVA